MYNNYPNYYQQASQTPRQTQAILPVGLKGRPVSSIDEVRAMTIDFDGSIFFFPDLANKRIYTKQINMDGTATLNMYELKPTPIESLNPTYITREEFDTVISQLQAMLVPQQPQEQPKQPAQEYRF